MKKISIIISEIIKLLFFIILIPFFWIALLFMKKKNIWIFGEKKNEARDNGYTLAKKTNEENLKNVKVVYVINKKGNKIDIDKLINDGIEIVWYGTLKHLFYVFCSKKIIASQLPGPTYIHPRFWSCQKHITPRKKVYFLGHGISFNNIIPLDKFSVDVCFYSIKEEKKNFKVNKKTKMVLMPMPRLTNVGKNITDRKKSILMFFRGFDGYKKVNLQDFHEELDTLNKFDITLTFHPSYLTKKEIIKNIEYINKNFLNITVKEPGEVNLQSEISKTNILVTDNSSLAFDYSFSNNLGLYIFGKTKNDSLKNDLINFNSQSMIINNGDELKESIEKFIPLNQKQKQNFSKDMLDFICDN